MATAGFAKLFTPSFVSEIYSAEFPDGAEAARTQADNAIAAADAKGDGQAKVAAFLLAANYYLRKKDAAKTEENLDDAAKLCRRLKYDEGKAYMLIMQAKLELWYGSAEEAVSWSRDALKLFKKLSGKSRAVAFASNVHAFVLSAAGQPQEGMMCAKEALTIYQDENEAAQQVGVLKLLMDMFISSGDTLRAGLVGWEIVKVVGDSGGEGRHKVKLADIIQKIAEIEFQGNDLEKSMQAAEDACSRFQQAGDVAGEAAVMKTMMNVYLAKGKFYDGIDVAKGIVELYRESGVSDKSLGGALMDLAQVYLKGDCFDEAVDAASQAAAVFQEAQDKAGGKEAGDMLKDLGKQQKISNMKMIIELNRHRLGTLPTNLIFEPDGLDIDAINAMSAGGALPTGKPGKPGKKK